MPYSARSSVRHRAGDVHRARKLRLRLPIETQGDVAQLAQILLGDLADGSHGVVFFTEGKLRARQQRAAERAVVMDKTELGDIGRRALAEGDQHVVAERLRRAFANFSYGGLIDNGHTSPLIDR